jgi:dTDP-glucose 4,6-dehydratase
MKTILVTGGLGFIGSNFLISYVSNNPKDIIINVDSESYASSFESTKNLSKFLNYTYLNIDINNYSSVLDLFKNYEFDLIIHFAAESHVDNSIIDPSVFAKTNVLGTLNLLQAFKTFKTFKNKLFYHVSTDEVYGSTVNASFNESSNFDPSSPYSASKASSDHFVKAFFKTYKLPVIVSNCSNNYGPWQHKEKLIPVVISSIIQNKRIPVYGKGLNVRDWIHVEDHISAINFLIKKGVIGESYCIGSNNELSNIELIKKICKISDKLLNKDSNSFDLVEFVEDRLGHDIRYSIDSNKLKKLGWKTNNSFDEYLEKTIKWYIDKPQWII